MSAPATASTTSQEDWSISVKTVGDLPAESSCNKSSEGHFQIQVSPDAAVDDLHAKIEASTGLKASQQRLIYRGRLLSGKLRDISGLGDGQTIHLVQKREQQNDETSSSNGISDSSRHGSGETDNAAVAPTTTAAGSETTRDSSSLENELILGSLLSAGGSGSGGGGGGGSILAALLGLSSLEDERRWGSSRTRGGSLRARRPHYRLTQEDVDQVPDPGSLEPVRQGLMTLHTLLPHLQPQDGSHNSSSHINSAATPVNPLEANREWYRGQWIDCRDTVNQWLEATIVEIVHPFEILPPTSCAEPALPRHCRPPMAYDDPAVSTSDLEGRRRLLLEPCEGANDPMQEETCPGFRQRHNNENIQLLLIHYNGWPHRWDEWIRSDSERIRPFRTRTRHPNSSPTACPTTQSSFQDHPSTHLTSHQDEDADRQALLPELSRTMTAVNDLMARMVSPPESTEPTREDLPWIVPQPSAVSPSSTNSVNVLLDDLNSLADLESSNDEDDDNVNAEEEGSEERGREYFMNIMDEDDEEERSPTTSSPRQSPNQRRRQPATECTYRRRELQDLATLLDRLGRTLTDAAPHLQSLAASLPEEQPEPTAPVEPEPESDTNDHPPLNGLLSLWSRERRRRGRASRLFVDEQEEAENAARTMEPDHSDYVSSIVNTTRGEVRAGPRSSRSSSDDVVNLLGAYLAAASLGGLGGDGDSDGGGGGLIRLLRDRGGNGTGGGGGIDIHIHAVVTTPGMGGGATTTTLPGGGAGLTAVGGGGGAARAMGLFSSARRNNSGSSSILRNPRSHIPSSLASTPSREEEEEDVGLFAELYSETPEPVDPNGSPQPGEITPHSPSRSLREEEDFLARLNREVSPPSPLRRRSSIMRRRRSTPSIRRRSSLPGQRSGWGRIFRRRPHRSGDDY